MKTPRSEKSLVTAILKMRDKCHFETARERRRAINLVKAYWAAGGRFEEWAEPALMLSSLDDRARAVTSFERRNAWRENLGEGEWEAVLNRREDRIDKWFEKFSELIDAMRSQFIWGVDVDEHVEKGGAPCKPVEAFFAPVPARAPHDRETR